MNGNNFTKKLKLLMDEYAHFTYKVTRSFPKEERYGLVSQIRRAALSVVLNYIEGFARGKNKVKKNFWEISYGSLKESKYLWHFAMKEEFCSQEDYRKAVNLGEEIGAMLWKSIDSLE